MILKNLQTLLLRYNISTYYYSVIYFNRMAEIQILDWNKLVSSYMIEILSKAIDNLQNLPPALSDDVIELEFRLNRYLFIIFNTFLTTILELSRQLFMYIKMYSSQSHL